jgi:hypothetical protein
MNANAPASSSVYPELVLNPNPAMLHSVEDGVIFSPTSTIGRPVVQVVLLNGGDRYGFRSVV